MFLPDDAVRVAELSEYVGRWVAAEAYAHAQQGRSLLGVGTAGTFRGRNARGVQIAALNVLAVARKHLGSLDKVTRIVRLGVSVTTSGDVRDQPKVADAASELLQDVFGKEKSPCRLVYGAASLPLGTPVELEIIFEVAG